MKTKHKQGETKQNEKFSLSHLSVLLLFYLKGEFFFLNTSKHDLSVETKEILTIQREDLASASRSPRGGQVYWMLSDMDTTATS